LLGIPIAYLGVLGYLTMIFLLNQAAHRWARIMAATLSGLGMLTSLFLLYYAQTVIQATCPWCIASGAAVSLLFLLSALQLRFHDVNTAGLGRWTLALGLVTALGVGLQAGWMQRSANTPPVPAVKLIGLTDLQLVDPAKIVGNNDAPVTVVIFSDLWCPMCRKAHQELSRFQREHPDRIRLAYRHLPLWEIRGHEGSGPAAALSEIAAEQGRFAEFIVNIYSEMETLII
jgi:hypothetical protein